MLHIFTPDYHTIEFLERCVGREPVAHHGVVAGSQQVSRPG